MVSADSRSQRLRNSVAALFVAAYVIVFAFVHSSAVRRSHAYGVDCLWLCDVSDEATWRTHLVLSAAFAPVYWLRQMLTGVPGPCLHVPLFELSSSPSGRCRDCRATG
ncbi:hypothetical protein Pan44_25210 [Caulifigura coniformis]|uniref:Uncharacterized protein n=1 Tax=Caulifigura coniformis TaxID=2527983 RepID=A0A517SEF3_9PLAN|nr:hypothetical protein Pan44_25210 [Caulifigura coniformis]